MTDATMGDFYRLAAPAVEALTALLGAPVKVSKAIPPSDRTAPLRRGEFEKFVADATRVVETLEAERTTVTKSVYVPFAHVEERISKAGERERIVTGLVHKPFFVDKQSEWISDLDLVKAMHSWALSGQKLKIQHRLDAGDRVRVLESFIAPADYYLNGKLVPQGAWVLSVKLLDESLYRDVVEGRLRGFSLAGTAYASEQAVPSR